MFEKWSSKEKYGKRNPFMFCDRCGDVNCKIIFVAPNFCN